MNRRSTGARAEAVPAIFGAVPGLRPVVALWRHHLAGRPVYEGTNDEFALAIRPDAVSLVLFLTPVAEGVSAVAESFALESLYLRRVLSASLALALHG